MNSSGYFITNLSGEAAYKSFQPTPLPVIDISARMVELLTASPEI